MGVPCPPEVASSLTYFLLLELGFFFLIFVAFSRICVQDQEWGLFFFFLPLVILQLLKPPHKRFFSHAFVIKTAQTLWIFSRFTSQGSLPQTLQPTTARSQASWPIAPTFLHIEAVIYIQWMIAYWVILYDSFITSGVFRNLLKERAFLQVAEWRIFSISITGRKAVNIYSVISRVRPI